MRGFSLLELMVVLALIAGLSTLAIRELGSTRGTSLQSGQATVMNLLMAARSRAVSIGRPVRVLVQVDARSPMATERYLRFMAMEEMREDGSWETSATATLPERVFVLPHRFQTVTGLLASGASWIKQDGTPLHSSCLALGQVGRAIAGSISENWVPLVFTAQGTTGNSGFLMVVPGRRVPPGGSGTEGPVILEQPDAVRGLFLSSYGVVVAINERSGFQ